MVDGLRIRTRNRTTKPLATALSRGGVWREGGGEGNLTYIQCKAIQNCHNESPCTTNIS
jgi:hypothetical protein